MTIKTDVQRAAFNYLRERKERFPGIAVEKLYLRNYPHDELAAQLFGTLREISPEELEERRYRGVAAGTRIGASGIEYSYDPLPARQGRLHAGRHQRARQPRRAARDHARRAQAGPPAQALARPRPAARRPTTRCGARSRPPPATAPRPAPTWRWTRATARCWRSAPTRASTPTCSPSRSRQRKYDELNSEARARRCSTARSPRPIRPARPSSSSPRWRRWRRG